MKRGRAAPKNTRPTKRARKPNLITTAIPEIKYFDSEYSGVAIPAVTSSWAGAEADPTTINGLCQPSRGDDVLNRDSRKIQVRTIRLRGYVRIPKQTNQTDEDNASFIRICLVQDKLTNGVQLNAEDVLSSGAASDMVLAFQSTASFGKFKVLKDIMLDMGDVNSTFDGTNIEQGGQIKHWSITHKFKKPITVNFNSGNAGSIADIVDNSFHVIAATNSATLAPELTYKARVGFIDI